MASEDLSIGNRVEILLDRDNDKNTKNYISVVEDIYDSEYVLMHMPISYGKLVKLPLETMYAFVFITEKGRYKFKAKIVKYITKDSFYFMVVQLCSLGERLQRREFFRYECILPFKFDFLKADETELNYTVSKEGFSFDGVIKDLGGGGIRFLSNHDLTVNKKIKCLMVFENEYVICVGNVIHKQNYPKSNYRYQYRVQFINISSTDKDMIVRYIFNEQLKNARKRV